VRERLRLLVADAPPQLLERRLGERRPADEQLVEHDAERVEIRLRRRVGADPRLGRHVARRAERHAGGRHARIDRDAAAAAGQRGGGLRRDRRRARELREPEVDDHDVAVLVDHQVRRLDVAGEHAARGRRPEAAEHARRQLEHLGPRHRPAQRAERAAADEVVDDVRLIVDHADPVHHDDVRVADPRDRARLDEEPLARRLLAGARDHLDGDLAIEQRVVRAVDHAHAAAAEHLDHAVLVDALERQRQTRRRRRRARRPRRRRRHRLGRERRRRRDGAGRARHRDDRRDGGVERADRRPERRDLRRRPERRALPRGGLDAGHHADERAALGAVIEVLVGRRRRGPDERARDQVDHALLSQVVHARANQATMARR
jgi:hypothetical protein